jgi:hypothetical protein
MLNDVLLTKRTLKLFAKVFLLLFRISLDGAISRLPVDWAYLSVFVDELVSLDEAKSFVDASSNRRIVLGDLSNNSLVINDEISSDCQSRNYN